MEVGYTLLFVCDLSRSPLRSDAVVSLLVAKEVMKDLGLVEGKVVDMGGTTAAAAFLARYAFKTRSRGKLDVLSYPLPNDGKHFWACGRVTEFAAGYDL